MSNYLNGRKREYKIKHMLEKDGWIVTRASGSHGPFDLISIHPKLKMVYFIQCKPKDFSKKEQNKLYKKYKWVDGMKGCQYFIK